MSSVLDPTKTFQTLDEWLQEGKKLLDINETEWKSLLQENEKSLSDVQKDFYKHKRLNFIQCMDTNYVLDYIVQDGFFNDQQEDFRHKYKEPSERAGNLLSRLSCLHQAVYFSFARAYASTLPGKQQCDLTFCS